MTTTKPMFVGGLTQSEPFVPSSSRGGRKSDTTAFADMMEVRGSTAPQPERTQPSSQNEQLLAEARNALNKMMSTDPLNGGGYKTHNISAMRQTLDGTLTMPGQSGQRRQSVQNGLASGQGKKGTGAGQTPSQTTNAQSIDAKPSEKTVPQNAISSVVARAGHVARIEQPKEAVQPAQSVSPSRTDTNMTPMGGIVPQKGIPFRSRGRRRSMEGAAFGIALPDRSRGIPLNIQQARSEAVQNVALNRNRFSQAERSEILSRIQKSSRKHISNSRLEGLGSLAAQYESGSDGIAAIGYDRVGGTSYGKYQIASRAGSMTGFLNFLDDEAPDISERLKGAGPANTGSRSGAMPDVWKQIAAEEPSRFESLQERFIHESHYEPALNAVSKLGYDVNSFSPTMKEVLWSTAVQHGPAGAANIFAQVADAVGLSSGRGQQRQESQIINEVYSLRAGRFGSSTPQIQEAARRRMESERQQAIAMTRTRSSRA